MKKVYFVLSVIISVAILGGCNTVPVNGDLNSNLTSSTTSQESAQNDTPFIENAEDVFSDRDVDGSYDQNGIQIKLEGDQILCSSPAVKINGTTVTLTKEDTYIFTGHLNDGRIVVDATKTDKLQLVFNGVSITCKTSAPLYILEADKVFVTLTSGSENSLINGGTFEAIDDSNIDGAVFSKQDLTFTGSGSLTIQSPAGHGIVCKDDMVIAGGSYDIQAAGHGIDANDSVRIRDAELKLDTEKDGIHAENTEDTSLGYIYILNGSLDMDAQGDGISAGSFLQIQDGTFDIVSGGGSENAVQQTPNQGGFPGGWGPNHNTETDAEDTVSTKGMKAAGNIQISDGSFKLDAADDAIHANGSVFIFGGEFEIATGDDGIHADETLTISDGDIQISNSYEGLEALHIQISDGEINLTATDDGLNAAGGTDNSGFGGPMGGDKFGGGRPGGGIPGGIGGNTDGSIEISGGALSINASGDGIDANGYLLISGGYTVVAGPTRGDTATLDYDTSATITGGTFIGTGASGMAQTFSQTEQGVFAISINGSCPAGTTFQITDKFGNEIVNHSPALDFSVIIVSAPNMVSGESYTIRIGEETATFKAS